MITDPTDCPYYLVSRATLLVTHALRQELRDAGVDHVRPAYLGVLLSLWLEDGLKVVELGRRAGLEPSTMTGLLDRMERDGLLSRSADPEDRRAQRIHLTNKGRDAKPAVSKVMDRALGKILDGVGEADLTRLKKTLRRVLANANKLGPA
ncbi:MAG: MarR family winged helix-turn-helix transcriptional regulator [Planctomycetota bacterium]|jgi:DNA-binding MarR family transcriptional regulator